ncbi:MAG: DNA alkylation repair protein [Calditrichia bacterium]|nr:DNA alkylation repair protein [Calditrichia bacterium]
MNIVFVTTELNKCLKYTNNEDDLISCLSFAFEKGDINENSEITILLQQDALLVKKMILRQIKEKKYNLNYVFRKIWWNKNKEINVIAAYFIPVIFQDPDKIDWILFRQVLDRLKSWDLTTIVSSVLEELITNNIYYWKIYLSEITKLNNKWVLRLAALIIGKIALSHKDLIPDLISLLMLIMRSKDWEVQQAISWCLNNMAGVSSKPIYELTNFDGFEFRRGISLN